jgi:NAD(P)-dependent dehydrogenase (short-subunit alcohol dehydrogenase family)
MTNPSGSIDVPSIDLQEKSVLVTGGSLGIGYAAAEACLRAGARVTICARGGADLVAAEQALLALDTAGSVTAIVADVTDETQVARAMDVAREANGPLDGVIHAAGIYGPIGLITDVDPREWANVIQINLFGAFIVLREACKRMRESGGGRIALFSGGGAASPFPNYSGYACSKAAVVRLTETAAIEMAPYGIEINCIAPGFVVTRLHEQTLTNGVAAAGDFFERTKAEIERGGVPASVGGDAAAFLVSQGAAGITGKFVAAPYDGYRSWSNRIDEVRGGDLFTLRRIVPRDRGGDWQ